MAKAEAAFAVHGPGGNWVIGAFGGGDEWVRRRRRQDESGADGTGVQCDGDFGFGVAYDDVDVERPVKRLGSSEAVPTGCRGGSFLWVQCFCVCVLNYLRIPCRCPERDPNHRLARMDGRILSSDA